VRLDLVADPPEKLAAAIRAVAPDVVVNCAGATRGSPTELRAANVLAVGRLLEAVVASGTRARLVHLGSAAEYGPGPVGVPVGETVDPQPAGEYGTTKLAGTRLVLDAAAAGTIDAIVLRAFNALGPGMPTTSLVGSALERLHAAAATGRPTIEMGPLDPVRDFVDLRDVGLAVAAACLAPTLGAPLVNIGSGAAHTARDLVQALADRLGFGGSIVELEPGSERSAAIAWQVADISLAGQVLGWSPRRDLGSTVDWICGTGPDPG
jgi:nucleoside-diphosphate-sugar epimerase